MTGSFTERKFRRIWILTTKVGRFAQRGGGVIPEVIKILFRCTKGKYVHFALTIGIGRVSRP